MKQTIRLKQQLVAEYRAVQHLHVSTYTARQLAGFFLACGLKLAPPYSPLGAEAAALIEAALRQEYARKHTPKRTVDPDTSKNIPFHRERYRYRQGQLEQKDKE
jgi:hypothetical protein